MLNVENFNASMCKTHLGITSSGDKLECAELTEINDIVNILNCSITEVKCKRERFIVELDALQNSCQKYSNAFDLKMHLMMST